MSLAELIVKLEAATEGGWDLDFEIQQLVEGWRNVGGGYREIIATGVRESYNYGMPSPPYTTSLDAALSLVPEGFYWEVAFGVLTNGRGPFYGYCYNDQINMGLDGSPDPFPGPTPALALCIASLRVRAQHEVNL